MNLFHCTVFIAHRDCFIILLYTVSVSIAACLRVRHLIPVSNVGICVPPQYVHMNHKNPPSNSTGVRKVRNPRYFNLSTIPFRMHPLQICCLNEDKYSTMSPAYRGYTRISNERNRKNRILFLLYNE